MRSPRRFVVSIAATLLALAGLTAALRERSDAAPSLDDADASILFVCRNGVAMSVWSALTFERLAAERGLALRAASRAAAPTYREVPLRMRLALALEGMRVGSYRPRVISSEDVHRAELVILIDTELPVSASSPGAAIESWGGFPPMREQYFASRAALRARVEQLVDRLAASSNTAPGTSNPNPGAGDPHGRT